MGHSGLLAGTAILAQVPQVMEPAGTVLGPPQVEQGQGAFPWLGQVLQERAGHAGRLPRALREAQALEELGW